VRARTESRTVHSRGTKETGSNPIGDKNYSDPNCIPGLDWRSARIDNQTPLKTS
jgi:hypothetical protein